MTRFTRAHINQLVKEGRIVGYIEKHSKKGKGRKKTPRQDRSAAKDWIGWNLMYWCNQHAVTFQQEYRFFAERKWRFDWAIESLKIAVEFEGGVFLDKSGHTNMAGLQRDIDKYHQAQRMGWKIIRLTAINYKDLFTHLNKLYEQNSRTT